MRTIIAGTRTFNDMAIVEQAIAESGFQITSVVSGCAMGVDRLGEQWALQNGIPVDQFPAEWRKHGRSAGPIRNRLMAENADALIAIWDGCSPGTASMIQLAQEYGLQVYIYQY